MRQIGVPTAFFMARKGAGQIHSLSMNDRDRHEDGLQE
jgi:hypothetical protein